MFYLIETQKQLDKFKSLEDFTQGYIDIIQSNNHQHPSLDTPIAIYLYSFTLDQGFIINIQHLDGLRLNFPFDLLNQYKTLYIYDKKFNLHFDQLSNLSNLTDIQSLFYLKTGKPQPELVTPFVFKKFYREYPSTQTNKIIPIGKLYEWCEIKRKSALAVIKNYPQTFTSKWYNNVLIPTLYKIEKEGIPVKDIKEVYEFNERFSLKEDKFFSIYNYQTTTGRPSNKFNNVNFMALQKGTKQRECIKAQNDKIVEIDYEGYHPRIIGEIVEFEFSNQKSIHEQLGQMYFKTESLTKEQYAKSKELTFKQLYGGIFDEFVELPFFKRTQIFIEKLHKQFNEKGFIELPISKRRFYKENYSEIGPQKLFNYYIQMSETEKNIVTLEKVQEFLKGKKTKLIMYMYDAFIFDLCEEENILEELNNLIQKDKFKTKIKIGLNFKDLREAEIANNLGGLSDIGEKSLVG